ncbi:alginate O-acetyltransferase AlgX-related protein [Neolewinella antarctica]|nr:hypothetical protein [Neolewinella antarctica]
MLPLVFTGSVGGVLVGHTPVGGPEWSISNWFEGSYQSGASAWLREHVGFRNDLVRVNNGKNYAIFGEITARAVVRGKDGYLYEDTYLEAATGGDARPAEDWDRMGREFSFVHDSLNARGIELLFVMAPGKGAYFPEFHPEPYASRPTNLASETALLGILRQRNIPHLNFSAWFREMKDTTPYPLFSRQGIHWTTYGQLLAVDSLLHYVEGALDRKLPEIVIDSIEVSAEQRGREADLFRGMNLPFEPSGYPLAYPVWHVGHAEREQPKVLVIGDSFYWDLYYGEYFSERFFGGGDFYYYFKSVHRGLKDIGNISQISLPDDLLSYDMIVIFETDSHYHGMGSLFFGATAEALLENSQGPFAQADILAKIEEIRGDEEWFNLIKDMAAQQAQTIDYVLDDVAKYMLKIDRKNAAFSN